MRKIKFSELREGDYFFAPQNRYRAPIAGTITKVMKVNFKYDTTYSPRPDFSETLHLQTAKCDLIGGKLKRNNEFYEIV